jgi:hypothetical protein
LGRRHEGSGVSGRDGAKHGSGGDDGATILLSDTVGFIRDIPTQLIAAFQATLEEVVHADLLLHVYDVSSAEAPRRVETVNQTLANLFGQRDLPMPPVCSPSSWPLIRPARWRRPLSIGLAIPCSMPRTTVGRSLHIAR